MPDWKQLLSDRLAPLRLDGASERDLADEITQHLDDRYRELRSSGVSHEEAVRIASAELDDMAPFRAATRPAAESIPTGDARYGNWLSDFFRDLQYACRTLRKSPVFVLVVVATLALGIGANTTVFTVINTLIINPLPVERASELAGVLGAESSQTSRRDATFPISYPDLLDYRSRNAVFQSLAGYSQKRFVTLDDQGASERAFAELVTHNYFDVLGLRPANGRFFAPEEDTVRGAYPVAVVSYGTWQTRFGGRSDIVGRTVRLNGIAFSIVGVAPAHFIGVNAIFGPDFWIPAAMAEALQPVELRNALSDRAKALFTGVGRLRAGVNRTEAGANLITLAAALAKEFPATHEGHTVVLPSISEVALGSQARSMITGGMVLLGVVGIVLLIACSNVSNLLMARSASRRQEIAIRLAIGANRARLIRQMLTESLLIGLMSGTMGLFLAYAGLQLIFNRLPSAANFAAPKLDGTVFLFALVVSLLAAVVFGMLPALQASRADVAETLKEEARTAGRDRRRITLANALVGGQVAFSFLLLVIAALFLRSIAHAYEMDPGFQTAHLAVFMTNPGEAGLGETRTRAYYKAALERVAATPGVASAAWSSNLPLWSNPVDGFEVVGRERRSRSDRVRAVLTTIGFGYFEASGIGINQGRGFTAADRESSSPVAIVNQKMAADYWPDGTIGKQIRLPGEKQTREIVGVARTANYTSWGEPAQPCVYVPLEQHYADSMTLFVRSTGDPRDVLKSVQGEMRSVSSQVLVSSVRTGAELVDGGLFQARMGVALLAIFGLLALGLASIGLYGVLAYSVNRRQREIGLRMALGATAGTVRRLVIREGMAMVGAGVLAGLLASMVAGRLLSRMLFGVSAVDPVSIVGAGVALGLIALVACYIPAWRATRVDPIRALHES